MTISYIEKGEGLHARIRAAGHWLIQSNGVWVSSDDAAVQDLIDTYTLADAIKHRQAECLTIAKALRDKAVAHISAGEMAAWPIKRAEALAFLQSGNPADAPILLNEAIARNISLSAMVAKVQSSATAFASMEAAISGADGKHRDTLETLTSFEEVLAYDLTAGWPQF